MAKAQGRLPSQKAAKKKVNGSKPKSTPTTTQNDRKPVNTSKDLPKVDNEAPVVRNIVLEPSPFSMVDKTLGIEPKPERKRFLGIFPVGPFPKRKGKRN